MLSLDVENVFAKYVEINPYAFIAYALQPPLTPKEYANNYHTRLQTQLDEFTGF